MARLTPPQLRALTAFAKHPKGGWGFRAQRAEDFAPPTRRLIARGFVEKVGMRGNRTVWQITETGRRALPNTRENADG